MGQDSCYMNDVGKYCLIVLFGRHFGPLPSSALSEFKVWALFLVCSGILWYKPSGLEVPRKGPWPGLWSRHSRWPLLV